MTFEEAKLRFMNHHFLGKLNPNRKEAKATELANAYIASLL